MQGLTNKWRGGRRAAQQVEEAPSARSEALLAEFEASGKGWFWETDPDGTLTYISDSVAEVLGRDPADLARETARVLKPGGFALVVFPQMEPILEPPNDYWRFTRYCAALLLERANAPQAGRRGQSNPLCQLDICHPALSLQFGQQATVDFVE